MHFEFATATRIIFGAGTLTEAAPIAAEWGHKALVVTGRSADRVRPLWESLRAKGIDSVLFAVSGEPTTETICQGSEMARDKECDLVIGFGGGSALDAGKAIAALITNGCEPYEYLEVVGRGKPLTQPPVPYIAIPTTAGTGTEVTRNAVILASEYRVKVSLRSPMLLPRLAVVDPELTYGLPPTVTANTGLDALTQVLEPYVSNRANPLTDALCREGLARAARSLRRAYERGDDVTAREDMAVTSLFGGLALANARLGAVHGFAAVLGGQFSAPHGAVCARLLPCVMAVNVQALRERTPDSGSLRRYEEISRILTGYEQASAEDGVRWVQELCEALNVLPLSSYGVTRDNFADLTAKAAAASSMQGNPIQLTPAEMTEILSRAW